MNIRKLIKSLLFIFVVFSAAFLVYKEFSTRSENNATNIAEKGGERTSVSSESMPVQEKRPAGEAIEQQPGREFPNQPTAKTHASKVIAYYFHGTYRCATCRTIERYSKEAIEKYFAKDLQNGTLEFKPVNVEDPENKHFIQDYQLFTRSLVLSHQNHNKEVKWKNLDKVWSLVSDREQFYQYVRNETEQYLKEIP